MTTNRENMLNIKEKHIIKWKLDKNFKESIYHNILLKEFTSRKKVLFLNKNIKDTELKNKKKAEF